MNKKLERKEKKKQCTQILETVFSLHFHLHRTEFQREKERDTFGSFIFPMLGSRGFEINWLILLTTD